MIFKRTDRDAFERASKGLTKKSRSKKYQKYKKQNAKRREKEVDTPSFFQSTYTPKIQKKALRIKPPVMPTQSKSAKKFIEKKNILDDIRDYRSSIIVSNISNKLATFIVKCGGQTLDNDTKNFIRSSIALAVSEVINKASEKPQEIIDNVKLFIKVGKLIYKIIVWVDKATNLWTTNEKSIGVVNENDTEYMEYINKHPNLTKNFQTINYMKYRIGDIVLLNNALIVRIIAINIDDKTYNAVSVDENQKRYVITDIDIVKLY